MNAYASKADAPSPIIAVFNAAEPPALRLRFDPARMGLIDRRRAQDLKDRQELVEKRDRLLAEQDRIIRPLANTTQSSPFSINPSPTPTTWWTGREYEPSRQQTMLRLRHENARPYPGLPGLRGIPIRGGDG